MGRLWLSIGFFGMASLSPLFAQVDILVRESHPTALRQGVGTGYEKKSFATTDDLQNYLQNKPQHLEWEPVVPLRATEVFLEEEPEIEIRDPFLTNQWPLLNQGKNRFPGADIDAIRAHSISKDANKIVFYVMDSGVDARHPDLAGAVTDFFDAFDAEANQAKDENGHGTHVAALVAAKGDNDFGTKGVVPGQVEVVSVRFLNANNLGDSSTAVKALEFIEADMARRRADDPDVKFIGVNSWGGEVYSRALEEAMQRLSTYSYLPITSAGNLGRNIDETFYYPCSFQLRANVCVAASTQIDTLAEFSNFGPDQVALMAPGDNVFSVITGKNQGNRYIARYQRKSGTSQAVPHVAGVAGLVWAANPNLSDLQVKEILLESVDRLPGAENYVLSGGRLNAYRALLMATGQDPALASRDLAAVPNEAADGSGGGCHLQSQNPAFSPVWLLFFMALSLFLRRRFTQIPIKLKN